MGRALTSNTLKTSTYEYIINKINNEGVLHFSLIDPDPIKQTPKKAASMAYYAEQAGTDAILIGGSTVFDQRFVDDTIIAIKEKIDLPIIIFPGGISNVSKEADAILFMSLLNSEDPYFIIGQQALASYTVKMANLEPISTAYLIIEPGATAGWIGKAKLLPREKPKLTVAYSLAAELFGFKLIYLEAGSGSQKIPCEIIKLCSTMLNIPIIAGGGVANKEDAISFAEAGADIIVMGSFLENNLLKDNGNALKSIIDEIKRVGKNCKKKYCLR
ncbi:MAG: geranylgeranylglyceryl/heptaprenylglyceryl phosphate synthase [Candidatus Lokiarchaeota archaeon]|nr:geranylgeranylglyceryl/heptaprenylglyceryl phosphate synthase [Candidatus Lokiarchaeota archaeon]